MCDLFAFWQGNVKYWYNPNNGSPDYYSACIHTGEPGLVPGSIIGGDTIYYQYPHSGDDYVGVYTYQKPFGDISREYVQTKFILLLEAEKQYKIGAFFNLSEYSKYATIPPQFKISKDRITNFATPLGGRIDIIPDIKSTDILTSKTDWIKVEGIYTAIGGEEWLTIGSFFPDSLSDTLFVGYSGTQNSNFVAYYFIDDVYVIPLDTSIGIDEKEMMEVSVYPNPTSSTFTIQTPDASPRQIIIRNLLGQAVFQKSTQSLQTQINLSAQSPGIYIIMVWDAKGRWWNGKVVKE